ncbi:MAG: exodeoxyribonuclease III [Myxococcota bacterium]
MSTLTVATWNVNSLRPRLDHVKRWIEARPIDVLCLQETKVVDELFPHADLEALGYTHRAVHGQKTYNGVAILSRYPLENVQHGFVDGEPDPQARILRATICGVRIIDCYVPNGAPMGTQKFTYKLKWYRRLRAELDAHEPRDQRLLLCGDMNVAPSDGDCHDPFEAEGKILFSEPERAALSHLTAWGMQDAYRKKNPFGGDFSWWDYRGNGFRYNQGFRIDHIYCSEALMKTCTAVDVDTTPRGWDRPSDHTPVVATFDL